MPEKPTNEPLAVLLGQSTVDIKIFLEVGEGALDFVVCVRHSSTALSLECEQVRQIEIHAVHCCAKPLVGVMAAAGPLRQAAAVDGVGVVRLPFLVLPDEVSLSVSVIVNTTRFSSLAALSLGFLVRYLRMMLIIWKWHICIGYLANSENRLRIPSTTIPLMQYPRFSIDAIAVR